jgi:hypothetical protein
MQRLKEEMPEDEFMVVEIEGQRIAFLLGTTTRALSSCQPLKKFTKCSYGLPKQEEAVLYLDSDSPKLKHLTRE